MRFPYKWYLANGYPAAGIEPNGLKVFGTFVCGGGSSMGYKLAGYTHLGGVEIDPSIAKIYNTNHHPKYMYVEDLRDFNKRTDLPDELYELDVLDGSPPCSTFSFAGSREDAWGKMKKFSEGQKEQTLDDLVFVYCDTIIKLHPKTFILENVKGLAMGNAKSYLRRIYEKLSSAGYILQCFIFNADTMGVPQKRERCIIIGYRNDMPFGELTFDFHEPKVYFYEIFDKTDFTRNLTEQEQWVWDRKSKNDYKISHILEREQGKNSGYTRYIVKAGDVCPTLTTTKFICYDYPRAMNATEIKKISTFPLDYQAPETKLQFLCGMSVPPVMMAQISYEIYKQWFSKLK